MAETEEERRPERARPPSSARGGFTLLEILVALVLIGLLAGALVPSVLNQLSKGETGRVAQDLDAVAEAAKSFRVDVSRWPGDLEDLVSRPSTGDTDINTAAFPTGLSTRWNGPYVEAGTIKGDTLPTGVGGVVLSAFGKQAWGGKDFLTVRVKGISQADARAISTSLDGDTVLAVAVDSAGRVRWKTGDTLVYLAAPLQ